MVICLAMRLVTWKEVTLVQPNGTLWEMMNDILLVQLNGLLMVTMLGLLMETVWDYLSELLKVLQREM